MQIYLDGADFEKMRALSRDKRIAGVTTNPSLMKKAGIKDYKNFAQIVLNIFDKKPVSLEVVADEWNEMERQARVLASWGENVYVKIPVTNTHGAFCGPLIERIRDLNLNITAVMTLQQIEMLRPHVEPHHIISVFAGRIADTGRDPMHTIRVAKFTCAKVLWASAREVLNVSQAEAAGANIITLTPDLIAKLDLHGKNLAEYSLETVQMFHADGKGLAI